MLSLFDLQEPKKQELDNEMKTIMQEIADGQFGEDSANIVSQDDLEAWASQEFKEPNVKFRMEPE